MEDSNGFIQKRTRGRTMTTPNPSVTTPIGTRSENSRDFKALSCKLAEAASFSSNDFKKWKATWGMEIDRLKLELEQLKLAARHPEEQRQGFQTQLQELRQDICVERERHSEASQSGPTSRSSCTKSA